MTLAVAAPVAVAVAQPGAKPRVPKPGRKVPGVQPKSPLPKSKLKPPKAIPITLDDRYQVRKAQQTLTRNRAQLRITLAKDVPDDLYARVVQWGGENRAWTLRARHQGKTVFADLPPELAGPLTSLKGKFNLALYDRKKHRLVSNAVEITSALPVTPAVRSVWVDAEDWRNHVVGGPGQGRNVFHVRIAGVGFTPLRGRKLKVRLNQTVTTSESATVARRKNYAFAASRVKIWEGGLIEVDVPGLLPVASGESQIRNTKRLGYIEVSVDGKKWTRVQASNWHYETVPVTDADGDGVASVAHGGADCDDSDPNRYPGNTEVCDAAGHDEDCDPSTFGNRDYDRDGFPDAACYNQDGASGTDCDDRDRSVYPTQGEVCNHKDDNCDGAWDEGVQRTLYRDRDHDRYGDPNTSRLGCPQDIGNDWVDNSLDCDDRDRSKNVGGCQ